MVTNSGLGHAVLRMDVALPMDDKDQLVGCLIDVNNDFLDQRA